MELKPLKIHNTPFEPSVIIAPEDFKSEWRETVTDEQYHADKTAVGSSSLRKAKKSLLAFAASMWGPSEESTKAQNFGTLVHLAILQPARFKESYFVMPEFESRKAGGTLSDSKNTKHYKQQVANWQIGLPHGAIVVTEEERHDLFCMIDSVLSHPTASLLLKNVKTEIAGYARDPETGIRVKIKPDVLAFTADILSDLKTCQDSYWPEFRRSVENYKYYFQDAQYAEIVKAITGHYPENRAWIAVENKFPFETRVHEVCPIYKEAGAMEYRNALRLVKRGVDARSFPGGQLNSELTEPSFWFTKEHGEML